MMPILSIASMGFKGLNTDLASWELPPEFINNGRNFRISGGAILSAGGQRLLTTSSTHIHPGHLKYINADTGKFWVVCGRNAVYVFDGATWSDITPAAGLAGIPSGGEYEWTSCRMGKIPLFNNPSVVPYYWSPISGAQVLKPLEFSAGVTWATKGYNFRILRSHKNFLFALSLNEGGQEITDGYRWSHPADINGLPFTWDETDATALAGKASLGGNGGKIIDGLSLRDRFVIYSENAINILDYTGDDFVWRRTELSESVGLKAKGSLIEVRGTHFLFTGDDIVSTNGNSVESIAHLRIRRHLMNNINEEYIARSFSVHNPSKNELWFCVPSTNSDHPDVAYVYNWKENAWAIRDIPSNTVHAAVGSFTLPSKTWEVWAGSWDDQSEPWSTSSTEYTEDNFLGLDVTDTSLNMFDIESGSEVDLNCTLERTNFPLEGHDKVTTITRVYPKVSGVKQLRFQFGSQDHIDSPVRWKESIIFRPGVDRKIDIRTTGELHCWRITSIENASWFLTGMEFEYTVSGKR